MTKKDKIFKEFKPFQFKKYGSIENTYRKKEINRIIEQGNSSGLWRVSEKIHGSNFSFWYNGKDLKSAKRTEFLDENSRFFNWQDIRMDEQPKIENLWKYLKDFWFEFQENFGDKLIEIVVHGEIFGGYYQHPDVKRNHNAMTVQKGVSYSPNNLFYVFDIKINGKFINEKLKGKLCTMFNFLWDEPLFEGTFEECLKYNNMYQTTIPKKLGLPKIKNNICEGNVIKPIEVKRSWAGVRVLLKNKNEKFAENTNNTGKKISKKKKTKEPVNLSPEAEKVLKILLTYVSKNRLRNVLSKMGPVNDKMFSKIMGNMNKDVMEDFLKDYREEFMNLSTKEQKYLPKVSGRTAAELLRKNFLNIIDNNF